MEEQRSRTREGVEYIVVVLRLAEEKRDLFTGKMKTTTKRRRKIIEEEPVRGHTEHDPGSDTLACNHNWLPPRGGHILRSSGLPAKGTAQINLITIIRI